MTLGSINTLTILCFYLHSKTGWVLNFQKKAILNNYNMKQRKINREDLETLSNAANLLGGRIRKLGFSLNGFATAANSLGKRLKKEI